MKLTGKIRVDRTERILRATSELLLGKCSSSITVRDVAKGAGLPKANIHYYFKGKGDLMIAAGEWLRRNSFQAYEFVMLRESACSDTALNVEQSPRPAIEPVTEAVVENE